jgi:hypothetical protein
MSLEHPENSISPATAITSTGAQREPTRLGGDPPISVDKSGWAQLWGLSVRWTEKGLGGFFQLIQGITLLSLGLSMAFGRRYPDGWAGSVYSQASQSPRVARLPHTPGFGPGWPDPSTWHATSRGFPGGGVSSRCGAAAHGKRPQRCC